MVGLGPLPSRPQRFDLSARGGPSSFRVAAILGLLSPRLWLALGSRHSRFSAKTKRFRQIGNQFRRKINQGPLSAEKKNRRQRLISAEKTACRKNGWREAQQSSKSSLWTTSSSGQEGQAPPPPLPLDRHDAKPIDRLGFLACLTGGRRRRLVAARPTLLRTRPSGGL